jgi:hypothetical protein
MPLAPPFPERQISFTNEFCHHKLTATFRPNGDISVVIGSYSAALAPVEAEQLAHCLLAWAKEAEGG